MSNHVKRLLYVVTLLITFYGFAVFVFRYLFTVHESFNYFEKRLDGEIHPDTVNDLPTSDGTRLTTSADSIKLIIEDESVQLKDEAELLEAMQYKLKREVNKTPDPEELHFQKDPEIFHDEELQAGKKPLGVGLRIKQYRKQLNQQKHLVDSKDRKIARLKNIHRELLAHQAFIQTFMSAYQGGSAAYLQKRYPVSIAFSTPEVMYIEEMQPVTLILDGKRTPKQTKLALQRMLMAQTTPNKADQSLTADSIQVTDIVDAHLTGSDFDVTSIGREVQVINKQHPTQWRWEVTPQNDQAHLLHLTINTKIRLGNESEFIELQTYRRDIEVRVTFSNWLSHIAEKYLGLFPILFGSLSLLSVYGWVKKWLEGRMQQRTQKPIEKRLRKPRPKRPPGPSQSLDNSDKASL